MMRRLLTLGIMLALAAPARADSVDDAISALKDPTDNVRLGAVVALAKAGDPRAVYPLIGALKDANKTVRGVAAVALGMIVDQQTKEPDRDDAIDALAVMVSVEPDSFAMKEASRAYAHVHTYRGFSSRAQGIYVEVQVTDATKGPSGRAASLTKATFEAELARSFRTTWPTGKSPTQAELAQTQVDGYLIDATLTAFSSGSVVTCEMSMRLDSLATGGTFANLQSKSQVDRPSRSTAEAEEMCFDALVRDSVATNLAQAITKNSLQHATAASATASARSVNQAHPINRAHPVVHAESATSLTSEELAKAPDAIRALGLGLEDCDADTMSLWIAFPLDVGDATYDDAPALARACAHGDVAFQQSTQAIADGIAKLTSDTTGALLLPLGAASWRWVWRKGQWWLAAVE
jgi:hypothetical protein